MAEYYQLNLDEFWRPPCAVSPYQDTDMLYCLIHEWFAPNAFYTPDEIGQMLEEQEFVDCPYCLAEIVGI